MVVTAMSGSVGFCSGLRFPGSAGDVVPQVAGLKRVHCDDFCRIHNRTAAQRNDEVTAVFPGETRAGFDGGLEGVGFDPVEDGRFHTREPELFQQPVKRAAFAGRAAVGKDDHRLPTGHCLKMQPVQLTCAEQNAGRRIKFVWHLQFLLAVYTESF